jgi:hypothetical protein
MWSWQVIQPKSTYNWVVNPSFEAGTTGWTSVYAHASVAAAFGYRGAHCLALSPHYMPPSMSAAEQVVAVTNATDTACVSASVYLTADQGASNVVGVSVGLGDQTYYAYANSSIVSQWQRVTLSLTGLGITNTTCYLYAYCGHTSVGSILWDAFQVEDGATISTYFDGDTPGCQWLGRPHYSASYRPVECRTSGVPVTLTAVNGGLMLPKSMEGWGRAPFTSVTLPFGLQGGSLFQRSIKQSRSATITGAIVAGAGGIDDLHNAQAKIGRLLGADVTRPQALTRLVYDSGAANGVELNADVIYEAGLEFNSLTGLTLDPVPLRFLQPDPCMVENQEQSSGIGGPITTSNASVFFNAPGGRDTTPGTFQPLAGSLFNSNFAAVGTTAWVSTDPTAAYPNATQLWCASVGNSAGQTVGGASTNGICWISAGLSAPSVTATSLGAGAYGHVYALQQAGMGGDYVYIGGDFSNFYRFSGTTTGVAYLARHRLSTAATDAPATTNNPVLGFAYCPQTYGQGVAGFCPVLYVGGSFTTANSVSHIGIFELDNPGSASPTLSSLPWGALTNNDQGVTPVGVAAMAVAPDGALYVLAEKNAGGSYIMQGAPGATSWTVIGTATANASGSLVFGPDGALYLTLRATLGATLNPGGVTLPAVCRWNGGGWQTVATGPWQGGAAANSLAFAPDGRLHMAGGFTGGTALNALTPGSVSTPSTGYAVWDGTQAHTELLNLYAGGTPLGQVAVNPNDGTVFAFTDSSPSNSSHVVPSTVSYQGTAPTTCRFVITCGTLATWVGGIRNERTRQAIYFTGLLLAPGEVLTVDTTPGASRVTSDMRGNLAQYVAPMSNLADFVLVEGENYLSVLASTALGSAYCCWYDRHYGIDGAGSNIGTATYEAN